MSARLLAACAHAAGARRCSGLADVAGASALVPPVPRMPARCQPPRRPGGCITCPACPPSLTPPLLALQAGRRRGVPDRRGRRRADGARRAAQGHHPQVRQAVAGDELRGAEQRPCSAPAARPWRRVPPPSRRSWLAYPPSPPYSTASLPLPSQDLQGVRGGAGAGGAPRAAAPRRGNRQGGRGRLGSTGVVWGRSGAVLPGRRPSAPPPSRRPAWRHLRGCSPAPGRPPPPPPTQTWLPTSAPCPPPSCPGCPPERNCPPLLPARDKQLMKKSRPARRSRACRSGPSWPSRATKRSTASSRASTAPPSPPTRTCWSARPRVRRGAAPPPAPPCRPPARPCRRLSCVRSSLCLGARQ